MNYFSFKGQRLWLALLLLGALLLTVLYPAGSFNGGYPVTVYAEEDKDKDKDKEKDKTEEKDKSQDKDKEKKEDSKVSENPSEDKKDEKKEPVKVLFKEKLLPFKDASGKWGYLNENFEEVIPAQFDYTGEFHDGFAFQSLNKKTGILKDDGTWLVEPAYYTIGPRFVNGLVGGTLNDYFDPTLVFNEKGELVIGPEQNPNIHVISYSGDKKLMVANVVGAPDNKLGFVDQDFQWKLDPAYHSLWEFGPEGYCKAGVNGLFGVLNEKFETVVPLQYGLLEIIHLEGGKVLFAVCDIAAFKLNEPRTFNYQILNEKGENCGTFFYNKDDNDTSVIFNPIAPEIEISGDLIPVRNSDGLYGYLNAEGKMAIEPQFQWAGRFGVGGLAPFRSEEGLYGFIDAKGKVAVKPQYARVDFFTKNCELCCVQAQNGLWGAINLKGEEVYKPQFNDVGRFAGPFNFAIRDGKLIILGEDHTEYLEGQYDNVFNVVNFDYEGEHYAIGLMIKGDKCGFVDILKGEPITDFIFDIPQYKGNFDADGLAKVQIGGLWGVINLKGEFVLEPKYQALGSN